MKKLTQKQKLRQFRKARKIDRRTSGAKRSKRDRSRNRASMWYRGAPWRARLKSNAIVRRFPDSLCFLKQPELTLQAFEHIRRNLHRNTKDRLWLPSNLNPRKEVTVSGYISMSSVKEISTSAALVLSAEYERRTMSMNESAPLFEIEKWDAKLVHKLDQIGFLDGFGYKPEKAEDGSVDADVMTVPFYSGTRAEMEKVDQKLLKLVEHIDQDFQISKDMRIALNSAFGEAANNTREHAYKEYHEFQYPHIGRWWATGAASARDRWIVVSLYDQGVTIPISYPRLPIYEKLRSRLNLFDSSRGSIYANDAKLIQAATQYGKSGREADVAGGRNNQIGGYGLPQIKDAIDLCGGGSLMILSRGGRYIYEVSGGVQTEKLDTYECSIGGTLVEWTVTLPEPGLNHG